MKNNMVLDKAKTIFQFLFPLIPSPEELIAIKLSAKISALRNNVNGGDIIARKALPQIIDFTQKHYDSKTSSSIKTTLKRSHADLMVNFSELSYPHKINFEND